MPAVMLFVGTHDGLAIYQRSDNALIRSGHSLAGQGITTIVATDARIVLVAVAGGSVQRSVDGGLHWSMAEKAPESIGLRVATVRGAVPLKNPRLSGATAYAQPSGRPAVLLGAGAGGMMLFRSEDDGIHWQVARIDEATIGRITALIPDPQRPGMAWAGTDLGVLLQSTDRGLSWQIAAREPVGILCLAAVPIDQ